MAGLYLNPPEAAVVDTRQRDAAHLRRPRSVVLLRELDGPSRTGGRTVWPGGGGCYFPVIQYCCARSIAACLLISAS